MGAHTRGAGISPFSVKNLPKNKDIVIPEDKLSEYKDAIQDIAKEDLLLIPQITNEFIANNIARKFGTRKQKFDYKRDMKMNCLYRQPKEYIWFNGEWDNYIKYLKREIKKRVAK